MSRNYTYNRATADRGTINRRWAYTSLRTSYRGTSESFLDRYDYSISKSNVNKLYEEVVHALNIGEDLDTPFLLGRVPTDGN